MLLFLLAASLLSACNRTITASKPTPNAAELGITDPAKPIEIAAGGEFTITVRVDRFDYHWEIAEALDPKVVAYVSKDYVPDDAHDLNSKGKDVWRFKAIAPGKTTIALGYYQGITDNAVEKPMYTVVVK